jgi:anti-anti-sigma factor
MSVVPTADGVRLTFNGPIHANVAWVEGELNRVADTNPKVVLMDLTGAEHISSMGLGILVGFNNQIRAAGGTIKIVAVTSRTVGILRIALLDKVFQILPSAVIDR